MYKRQIDLLILGFSLFLMCLITFVAFIGAAAYDEGTGETGFCMKYMACLDFLPILCLRVSSMHPL